MSYIQIPGSGGAGGGGIAASLLSAGNTSGTLTIVSSGTLQLAGGNNITLSQNGASVTISGGPRSPSLSVSGNNTSGTLTLVSTGTLQLAGGNNITLSQNGQSLTISANLVNLSLSGNTSGALALISTGTAIFAGGNNITLSQNGQSVTISGPAGGGTLSIWEPTPFNQLSFAGGTRAIGQSSLYLYPLYVPVNLSATQMMQLVTVSLSSSSNSSVAAALSLSAGIYTLTGSTLNLLTASSGATNVQFTNTNNVSFNSINGLRGFTVPLTFNATPGNYWIGIVSATATSNTNWVSMSQFGFVLGNTAYSGQIGEAINATRGAARGAGFYSLQTAAFPTAIGLSDLTQSNQASIAAVYMQFAGV